MDAVEFLEGVNEIAEIVGDDQELLERLRDTALVMSAKMDFTVEIREIDDHVPP